MTKNEFIKQAKSFGYQDGWIENAINKMNELNDKFGFNYSYEDIVLHEIKKKKDSNNKFSWSGSETVLFKPKKRNK